MARKPTRAQPTAAPDDAADFQYPDAGYDADIGFEVDAPPSPPRRAPGSAAADAQGDEEPVRSRLDGVVDALAALPAGDAGRTLKLALLDALEASTRADRIALPVEVQGLRARVRAGTL